MIEDGNGPHAVTWLSVVLTHVELSYPVLIWLTPSHNNHLAYCGYKCNRECLEGVDDFEGGPDSWPDLKICSQWNPHLVLND